MTNPAPSQPANPSTPAPQAPAGVRIASTLAWVVGILTILIAFAIGIPAISSGAGLLFIVINVIAGAIVCVAAVQIRLQRRMGVLLPAYRLGHTDSGCSRPTSACPRISRVVCGSTLCWR